MKKLFSLMLALIVSAVFTAGALAAQPLTLMLDWFPNVDHLPIYVAQEKGYFAEQGIEVKIISPTETSDALKLAASGNVDLAVSYQPQTIIAADQGLDIKAVSPLVAHPLTTLLFLADSGIKSPTDLSGKNIGYTVPGLMDVLLKAFADINEIKDYQAVNVGFTILPSLVSNKVEAVMGPFKTYETVGMAQHGYKAAFFELEKYGIPDYEELIFVAGPKTLETKAKAVKGFVDAMAKSFSYVKGHPKESLALYLAALPEADKTIETGAFELTLPYFSETTTHDTAKWKTFAEFAHKYGLIKNPVDATQLIHQW